MMKLFALIAIAQSPMQMVWHGVLCKELFTLDIQPAARAPIGPGGGEV